MALTGSLTPGLPQAFNCKKNTIPVKCGKADTIRWGIPVCYILLLGCSEFVQMSVSTLSCEFLNSKDFFLNLFRFIMHYIVSGAYSKHTTNDEWISQSVKDLKMNNVLSCKKLRMY